MVNDHLVTLLMEIRTVSRKKTKIRINLSGLSFTGKTYSALRMAYGICGDWGKVCVIDTENNSADMYENMGQYQVIPLESPYSPDRYVQAINLAVKAGMEVIIVDSVSHEWDGLGGILNIVDMNGAQFQSGWKKGTAEHDKFKRAVLESPLHMITTTRQKVEYVLEKKPNRQGTLVDTPVKKGMKDIQREGWDYEHSINFVVFEDHTATPTKDRTLLFVEEDGITFKNLQITEETGKLIAKWCNEGADAPADVLRKETDDAIRSLADCTTVQDLIKLNKSLSASVTSNERYRTAGSARKKEIEAQPAPDSEPEPPAENPATPQAQASAPDSQFDGMPVINGSDEKPVDVGKYILRCVDVDSVNATLAWLRNKERDGENPRSVSAWKQVLHEKASTIVGISYDSKAQRYFVPEAA